MSTFPLEKGSVPVYYAEQAADGSRWLVYYQPVGEPWSVVIRPMQYAQEQAMAIVARCWAYSSSFPARIDFCW
jgi:hypothetical protein